MVASRSNASRTEVVEQRLGSHAACRSCRSINNSRRRQPGVHAPVLGDRGQQRIEPGITGRGGLGADQQHHRATVLGRVRGPSVGGLGGLSIWHGRDTAVGSAGSVTPTTSAEVIAGLAPHGTAAHMVDTIDDHSTIGVFVPRRSARSTCESAADRPREPTWEPPAREHFVGDVTGFACDNPGRSNRQQNAVSDNDPRPCQARPAPNCGRSVVDLWCRTTPQRRTPLKVQNSGVSEGFSWR
jgi:hypothetical protein